MNQRPLGSLAMVTHKGRRMRLRSSGKSSSHTHLLLIFVGNGKGRGRDSHKQSEIIYTVWVYLCFIRDTFRHKENTARIQNE